MLEFRAAQQTRSVSGIGLSPLKLAPYFISHRNPVWGPGVSNTHHGYFLPFPTSLTTVVYSDKQRYRKEGICKNNNKKYCAQSYQVGSTNPQPFKIKALQNSAPFSPCHKTVLIYTRMLAEEAKVNVPDALDKVPREEFSLSVTYRNANSSSIR